MFDDVKQDLGRLGRSRVERLKKAIVTPSMWAVFAYRLRRWVRTSRMPTPLRWAFKAVSSPVGLFAMVAANAELPASADIGPGLLVPHLGYVVVGMDATIGRHCTLAQGVTIGHARGGASGKQGSPVLGDRVYVGPGAIVIGPITIGDDALIGAGAVVIRPVPARAVVVGNPARAISDEGSFDLIRYPGMESDPLRIASLGAKSSGGPPRRGHDDALVGASLACHVDP